MNSSRCSKSSRRTSRSPTVDEKEAEKILEEFSKTLDKVPELEGTYYITDNLNLNREDESEQNDSTKIVRNARTDKDGNVVVKKAEWTG